MTSSYAITQIGNLTDRFTLADGLPKGIKPVQTTKPTDFLPVIIFKDGKNAAVRMKWGFVTQGAKDTNGVFRYKTFNARSEDVFKKLMFAKAIRTQRCLVPCEVYYDEVQSDAGTTKYSVSLLDNSLMALAGVHSTWEDTAGRVWQTFSIVTTTGNKDTRAVGAKRMPVILKKEVEAAWLDPTIEDMNSLYDMMRPYTPGTLSVAEVSAP